MSTTVEQRLRGLRAQTLLWALDGLPLAEIRAGAEALAMLVNVARADITEALASKEFTALLERREEVSPEKRVELQKLLIAGGLASNMTPKICVVQGQIYDAIKDLPQESKHRVLQQVANIQVLPREEQQAALERLRDADMPRLKLDFSGAPSEAYELGRSGHAEGPRPALRGDGAFQTFDLGNLNTPEALRRLEREIDDGSGGVRAYTLGGSGRSTPVVEDRTAERYLQETLGQIKRAAGGRTFFEVYLEIIGQDARTQIQMARDGTWILADSKTEGAHGVDGHMKIISSRPPLIDACHPFFLSTGMVDLIEVMPPEEYDQKAYMIDQPFKSVWVERTDGGPLFQLNGTTGPAWIMGILCYELPNSYFSEILLAYNDHRRGRVSFRLHTGSITRTNAFGRLNAHTNEPMPRFAENTMMPTAAHDVLFWVFRKFRSDCAFANEKVTPIRARVGSGAARTAVKINRVVRVMLKGERKEYERGAGRVVDWSHKWEVMGHWRHVEGIGKDRDGNYTVRGQTWVSPHTKGKGALVKKQRIVKDQKEEA